MAALGTILFLGAVVGIWRVWSGTSDPDLALSLSTRPSSSPTNFDERTGSLFTPLPLNPFSAPRAVFIRLPDFSGAYAAWGATGRDARGHIWVGVSARDVSIPSAHLCEYDPDTRQVFDRGDVVSALERCGVCRRGEGQQKIHSRIVQGADGHLYFASLDEQGENEDGSRLPTWGGHLWRLRLPENRWEHLQRVPEGLIAVAGSGNLIYALGYFGHVLYQYNCESGAIRSIRVGSIGGHISRNFVADVRGHVYVPRLTKRPGQEEPAVALVEFDPELREVAATPLGYYLAGTDPVQSHGIVGLQHLADGSIVFITHQGCLYRITPEADLAARVTRLGLIDPNGPSYTPALFTFDGTDLLLGLTPRQGESRWLVYDLARRTARMVPVRIPDLDGGPVEHLMLYGSMARDNQGNFYVVGTGQRGDRVLPLLVQLQPAP
jgi:hypothetical protein